MKGTAFCNPIKVPPKGERVQALEVVCSGNVRDFMYKTEEDPGELSTMNLSPSGGLLFSEHTGKLLQCTSVTAFSLE